MLVLGRRVDALPGPSQPQTRPLVAIRTQLEMRALGVQIRANDPVRIEDVVCLKADRVLVFKNAAHLHVRQRQGLGQVLQSLGLDDRRLKGLALEVRNRAIRPDGARLDVVHALPVGLGKLNFDVGVFAPLFLEDLDAIVRILVRIVARVVALHLAEEDDGRRARSLGLRGHLQLVGVHRLEADARQRLRGQCQGQKENAAKEKCRCQPPTGKQHGLPLPTRMD